MGGERGRDKGPGAARRRQGEALYKMVRGLVVKRVQQRTPIQLSANGQVKEGRVAGTVVLDWPNSGQENAVMQVVIAERGVVYHGSSTVVIHRMLARGLATKGSLSGVAVEPDQNGHFELTFDRSLAELQAENEAHLEKLEDGKAAGVRMGLRIEPNSVEVIVVLRDAETGTVHQAAQCSIDRPEAAE